MDKELDVHTIYRRTVDIWKEYAVGAQLLKEKLYINALETELNTLYYLISLLSVGLAINEALLAHDAPTSIADVSVAVRFLYRASKEEAEL